MVFSMHLKNHLFLHYPQYVLLPQNLREQENEKTNLISNTDKVLVSATQRHLGENEKHIYQSTTNIFYSFIHETVMYIYIFSLK